MNEGQRLEFVDMWNAELDQIESLDITAWLRAYSQIHIRNNPGPAMELVARIDDKIRTAADTIEQLTKERDEARRERDETRREFCELCAPEWGLQSPQWLAEHKGWDCYKETT
jgi:FtsZ-binding cell division protein ZapB